MEINNRRYLGSKYKLTNFIKDVVDTNCGEVNTFYDVFAGTGVVANVFKDKTLITNDILYSNYISHYAWFFPESYRSEYIHMLIERYNSEDYTQEENYMTENFANTYFSRYVCAQIGHIREDIETRYLNGEMNLKERNILITSLLYAMDKIANTVGHYDAYRKGVKHSESLILRPLNLCESLSNRNVCLNGDANVVSEDVVCDIAYLDPPYNSRQYSDAYHLLENVAKWEKPKVHGDAKKMDRTEIKSKYCTNEAGEAMMELIGSLNAKYILLSYNNTGMKLHGRSNARISDVEILNILKTRGEVTVFSQKHNAFSTGKSNIEDNEERLFLCKVNQNPQYIQSPLNYTGGKHKLLPQILPHFPKSIDTFVDLFCGGGNVGVNVAAKKHYYNDKNKNVIGLLEMFSEVNPVTLIGKIDKITEKYNLSNTSIHGYEHYNCESSSGLATVNKEPHRKLRDDFNELTVKNNLYFTMLFTLIIYSFNNQLRFNGKDEYNLPVGKRDLNPKMREKVKSFSWKLKSQNSHFSSIDYKEYPLSELTDKSLVYADPPYLITTATYNEQGGWTEDDERGLLSYLDNLNECGFKFALSNVFEHKGKTNEILIEWAKRYKVIHLNKSYNNSNYQTNGSSDEVLIINY